MTTPPARPGWPVILTLVATMALWGGTWPVGKVVAGVVGPWTAALLRFTMGAGVLVLICLLQGGVKGLRVRPALLPHLFLLGATGIFGYSFLFFTGAFLGWIFQRWNAKKSEEYTFPVASGVIAGGSLMGVVLIFWENGPAMVRQILHQLAP